MVFELLNEELQALIKERFKKPTLPQEIAIPKILNGKNVLIIAPVGSGKTEAAILPILNFIIEKKPEPISTLFISPLKALNRDMLERMIWWCNKLGIETSVRHGDTSTYERKMQVEFPVQLLILTLETLQPILVGKKIREHLKNVRWVIVDEVHEIVDSKRGAQLALALERLRELCGNFTLIMLSATVGEPEKVANFFSGGKEVEVVEAKFTKPMEIKVIREKPKNKDKKIARKIFSSFEIAARLRKIMELIRNSRSTITFTNTRDFAEILTSRIKAIDEKFPIGIHHSSLSKEVRIKAEKEFKKEKLKSLIATSSLQLGIDIGSIDLILQYQSPRQVTQLIQRIGRSGHALEKISKGIVITTDEDDIFESSVIARKALNGELEKIRFYEKSYDVLSHQIVGLAIEYGKIDLKKAFEILRKAEPCKKIGFEEFVRICKFLEKIGLIFLNSYVKKKRASLNYYFENLSTIPSTKQYKIVNIVDKSIIGNLDEEFIALHAKEGENFIVKGEAWKILSIDEDKVFVEPTEDIEAAIPAWEGELIPVPFEVAKEVGELRRKIAENLENEKLEEILSNYPIDENCKKKMVELIKEQAKFGIPDEKTIIVESFEDCCIVHSCFGSQTNEALARFLSSFVASKIGEVKIKSDPYRIIIHTNEKIIAEAFKIRPEYVRFYIEKNIENSELFAWKFLQVAKRFGIIKKEIRTPFPISARKIIDEFKNTPVHEETMREIETEKIDIEKAKEVIEKVQNGEISLKFIKGLSPLGKLGLKGKAYEIIKSEKAQILKIFKERLFSSKINLICLNCADWMQSFLLREMPENIKCKKCEAKLLAVSKKISIKDLKIVKKYFTNLKLKSEEISRLEYLKKTAELFLNYGKKSAIVLSARGIGPETAKRILAKKFFDENSFYNEILKAEKMYLQTKRFWKI